MSKMIQVFPSWLLTALKELGQSEIKGAKHNKRIIEYHSLTTLKATDDETPWCSSFTNWVLDQNKIKGTGSAAAISWLNWGQKTEPKLGAITIVTRASDTNPNAAHVGFLWCDANDRIFIIGGNQGDKVSIAPYRTSSVIGYRWPHESDVKLLNGHNHG
jgi:uncharacterized protein (TIGR02594 family)